MLVVEHESVQSSGCVTLDGIAVSMRSLSALATVLCWVSWISWCRGSSEYREHLHLQPLSTADLLASFHFQSNTTQEAFDKQDFRFFPRALGQILRFTGTEELHLRFSYGRWNTEQWGERPWNGTKEGGTGVELWAWIDGQDTMQIDERWTLLTNSLSGLFCASINFIDSTRTIRPRFSFQRHDSPAQVPNRSGPQVLHGTLAREVVCTENMTPMLKLLPCKGKAGIASLLEGHRPFDASWQTMAIDVKPVCGVSVEDCVTQFEITLDMVMDIERAKRQSNSDPIPRPAPMEHIRCDPSRGDDPSSACFPIDDYRLPGWTIHEIFGRGIQGSCPVDQSGEPSLCLGIAEDAVISPSHEARGKLEGQRRNGRCFDLKPGEVFDLTFLHEQEKAVLTPLQPASLYASRSMNGQGQESGSMEITVENLSESTLVVDYLESLPWFLKAYVHTLQARVTGESGRSAEKVVRNMYYRPHEDRSRGGQLELQLTLPPRSTVVVSYDFEKAILRYTEYPPDANRGFDVAASVLSFTDADGNEHEIRTTPLLLPLPTPDFSMPYNVIILTSTVIALAFGSIFNIIVRRFVAADEAEGFSLGSLRAQVLGRVEKVRRRFQRRDKIE